MTRKPDLFIVGAPKAGTTSLYEYLAGHPQIHMSLVKEPTYFCPDVRSWRGDPPYLWPADEAGYVALFDTDRSVLRRGEASTRYLVSHDAARLVHDFNPDARALVMLRNPVDLVHALHNERVSQGHEPLTDFVAAMAAEEQRSRGIDLPGGSNPIGAVYRESALFARPVQRWFDALGRNRVHVIVFDDFARDPQAELGEVLTFAGVTPDYAPASFAPRNISNRQRRYVRKLVDSRLGNWLTDDVALAILGTNRRARLASSFRNSRLNRRVVSRQPMPDSLRHQLEADFRVDVEATGQLLGRDLVALWFGRSSTE